MLTGLWSVLSSLWPLSPPPPSQVLTRVASMPPTAILHDCLRQDNSTNLSVCRTCVCEIVLCVCVYVCVCARGHARACAAVVLAAVKPDSSLSRNLIPSSSWWRERGTVHKCRCKYSPTTLAGTLQELRHNYISVLMPVDTVQWK